MKRAFAIAGILLFAFLSGSLLLEYGGVSMGNTILFRLAGDSEVMDVLPISTDLSPSWVGALWWLELAVVIAGFATHRGTPVLMTVLAMDAALLICFYKPALHLFPDCHGVEEPPIGYPSFLLFAYADAVLSVLYGAWLAACAIQRRNGRLV